MAFDGITTHCLVSELKIHLSEARISKIAQPEEYELLLSYKSRNYSGRILISANASLPYICETNINKQSPLSAPNFCMVLRKHISNGRITEVEQLGLDRVIRFTIEHLNELGDLCRKFLYVEIMGKHSNIIFTDEDDVIIDAIKHVSYSVSSVREVLPGRKYFVPVTDEKYDPFALDEDILESIFAKPLPVSKAIYTSLTGFSPVIGQEIAYRAHIDGDLSCQALNPSEVIRLTDELTRFIDSIKDNDFAPCIYYSKDTIRDYFALPLSIFEDLECRSCDSISYAIDTYFAGKNQKNNISQRSQDLRKNVSILLDRNRKKLMLQEKQLKDTDKMETCRIYGELLNTYAYMVEPMAENVTLVNYYDNKEITIPLDASKTAAQNAVAYFEKYNKLKRTRANLTDQIEETKRTISHLASIETALSLAESQADLNAIHDELYDFGYVKKRTSNRRKDNAAKSKPLHYVTSDGFDIYVGRNNYQNDELTFKFATGNDWWFHIKKAPGSHVVLKNNGREIPDHIFEKAASVAAYYSSCSESGKVEIDYLQKKNVKKPANALPGFVIYYTNYSMLASPSLEGLTRID